MKALDIVRTPGGGLAVIKETNKSGRQASIDYIRGENPSKEKNAWWYESELEVVDSIPNLLGRNMAHPFGAGKPDVDLFFKID